MWSVVTQKRKYFSGNSSSYTSWGITASQNYSTELTALVKRFSQKLRVSLHGLRLWNIEAKGFKVNRPKTSKLVSITSHLAKKHRLHSPVGHDDGNHSLLQWLDAVCHLIRWQWNEGKMKTMCLLIVECGVTCGLTKIYIRELGIKGAVYERDFESHDLVKFPVGVRDPILQQAPSHQYGT